MALSTLPLRRLNRVFHVGTLDPTHKGVRGASQEGNGLSISLHPEEWTQIAKLGGGDTFKLSRKPGLFLDFHKLSKARREQLTQWGLTQGWCEMQPRWKLVWVDSETEEPVHMLLDTEVSARSEQEFRQEEDESASVEPVQVPVLTPTALERLGFKVDALSTLDMLATFYVEDCTEFDGVWWNDMLDPYALSAPRGVIVRSRLPQWTIERA
jgi:hypothetical protein